VRRYRRMDLLKVLRLRHIKKKAPTRGRSFRRQRAFRQNFGAEQPGTLSRDRPYLWCALPRITKGRKIRPGFVGDVRLGRIFKSPGAPQERQWMWASGHGYEPTHEAGASLVRVTLGRDVGIVRRDRPKPQSCVPRALLAQ
jgi:hypothetical protein